MPLASDWAPRALKSAREERPAPVVESSPHIVQPPQVIEVRSERVTKELPRGWSFVPVRDANNLIVEIVATPLT